jgi:hypothetical protein
MDDSHTAFATHYPSYGFDLDMMKVCPFHCLILITQFITLKQRSMDTVGGPDAKKARWSPTFNASTTAATPTAAPRDAFANYGYGPHAQINQPFQTSSPGFSNPLYSTPNLTINTAVNGAGMNPQMSPANPTAFAQQQQQQQTPQPNGMGPYAGFGYNMLGMGLPGMNMLGGFPYGAQAGNFGQVLQFIILWHGYSPSANLICIMYSNPDCLL